MTDSVDPQRAAEIREQVQSSMADFAARARRLEETPLTVTDIGQLADEDLDERLWLRLASRINYFDAGSLRAQDPDVAAYLATRVFEWEVANGGLHQYFFNFPDPDHLALVLDGYARLGLEETRQLIQHIVAPIASAEAQWRESLRDGLIETFFESYVETRLPEYDDRIDFHNGERLARVRAEAAKFAC